MLVISMGVLLIAGTMAVGVLAWKKGFSAAPVSNCIGGTVDLKGRGTIISSQIEGNKLRLTLKKEAFKTEIVTLDLCTGKTLGTLTLETSNK